MKRAFLVLGPPASGTRMMTGLMISAGCWGDSGHEQRLDNNIPDEELIVWRRSVPHGTGWPNLGALISELVCKSYNVTALVMSRDWFAMSQAQAKEPYAPLYAPNKFTTLDNLQRSYREIFGTLRQTNIPFSIVNYETLVQRPHLALSALLGQLNLPTPDRVIVYDGNAKYYKEAEYETSRVS